MLPKREYCREELGEAANFERCNQPAEFILWGKLFRPDALGPRCYDHAAHHVGHSALSPNDRLAYAIYDLRPVNALHDLEDAVNA